MLKPTYLKLTPYYRTYQTKPYLKSKYNNEEEVIKHNGYNIKDMVTNITMWKERWFLSSNAKDIGTLYLMFALFSGLIGTAFSVLIRLELSGPGVQYIADNQLYNSIITAHAILMIFFMVKSLKLLNKKPYYILFNNKLEDNNIGKDTVIISSNNDNNNDDNSDKFIPKYTKILVDNPFNNRDIILRVTKKQKGVYIWESLDGKYMYVGHSINLYNRINSYFMPSILNTKARKVIRYLNKYGFNDIKLHIYVINIKSSLEEVVKLEQHFIDNLKPNLNVDLITSSSGYHEPRSQKIRDKLRAQIGTPIYMYKAEDFTLLYIFESKQYTYNSINIHHKTLNDCLNLGNIYLDALFFSLDIIEESPKTNLLSLEELKKLVNNKRDIYKIKHPESKAILAEFKNDSTRNLVFNSLNSLSIHLKGDRQVIREYLKGNKSGYYRGVWKFTYLK